MESMSPSISNAEESNEGDTSLNIPVAMSFVGIDPVTWTQQSLFPGDPNSGLEQISFGPLDDSGFDYSFSFGANYFGLPSPPNSNTSIDPPSPSNGIASSNPEVPISLDPTLTNASCVVTSTFDQRSTNTGTKRKGDTSRPKTSHTTIERRYRNNLNTRMIGLRQAVPALRILDKNIPAPPGVVDILDERGYVDGVRAAKKSSKSTILGKATEYIMVLKRRENRLRTELHAFKMFIVENIPDGANTLATWESNHYAQFGGEQADELPPQDMLDEEDDDDDEGPRPAKKAKTKASEPVKQEVKVTAPAPVGPNGEPLKRKRGRPRKVPVTLTKSSEVPISVDEPHFSVLPHANTVGSQSTRYLLTAFVFFSFLGNLPSSTNSFTNTHEGTVLNQLPVKVTSGAERWDGSFVKFAQLATSLLLLLSLFVPHLSAYLPSFKHSNAAADPEASVKPIPGRRNNSKSPDIVSDLSSLLSLAGELIRYIISKNYSEQTGLSWKKTAQKLLLSGAELSVLKRIRLYLALSSVPDAAAERALIGYPVFPSSATRQWAQTVETDDEIRKLAFSRSIEDSLQVLEDAVRDGLDVNLDLATNFSRIYLAEELNSEALRIFVKTVIGSPCRSESEHDELPKPVLSKKRLLEHGDVLGADLIFLSNALEDIESNNLNLPDLKDLVVSGALVACRDLIRATQLFMELFPNRTPGSTIEHAPLSPPPSPSKLSIRHHLKRKHELRCLLGRAVFDEIALDEARDVVVDLLTRSP